MIGYVTLGTNVNLGTVSINTSDSSNANIKARVVQ